MNLVKASLIIVTVYAGLAASQVSDDQVMPWWPNSQDRQNLKVGESSLEDQTQKGLDQENEVNNEWLTDTEDDTEKKDIFFRFVNNLLWDADTETETEADGRRFNNFRRRGLMQRPMPQILRRDNNIVGQSYRGMVDACYGIACSLGLQSIADSIARMFF